MEDDYIEPNQKYADHSTADQIEYPGSMQLLLDELRRLTEKMQDRTTQMILQRSLRNPSRN